MKKPTRPLHRALVTCVAVFAAFITQSTTPHAQIFDDARPYATLRLGSAVFDNPSSVPVFDLESPSKEAFANGSVGLQFGRYLGVELSGGYLETDVLAPGSQKIAEYGIWHLLGQVQLRYPLLNDRFVPYLIGGVGGSVGQINDREYDSRGFSLRGEVDPAFAAAFGGGFDYFVEENIAFGLEARKMWIEHDILVNGQTESLDYGSIFLFSGIKVLFGDPPAGNAFGVSPRPAVDTGDFRFYLALRGGLGMHTKTGEASGVNMRSFVPFIGSASVGANLNENWAAELAIDATQTELTGDGVGRIGDMAITTIMAQTRYRFPTWEGKLSPYLLAGGGVGFAEFAHRKVPTSEFDFRSEDLTPVAAVGGGVDYYVAHNLALTTEAKYLFLTEVDAKVNGRHERMSLDAIILTCGLRILFP